VTPLGAGANVIAGCGRDRERARLRRRAKYVALPRWLAVIVQLPTPVSCTKLLETEQRRWPRTTPAIRSSRLRTP
jgi:hypothetical protein